MTKDFRVAQALSAAQRSTAALDRVLCRGVGSAVRLNAARTARGASAWQARREIAQNPAPGQYFPAAGGCRAAAPVRGSRRRPAIHLARRRAGTADVLAAPTGSAAPARLRRPRRPGVRRCRPPYLSGRRRRNRRKRDSSGPAPPSPGAPGRDPASPVRPICRDVAPRALPPRWRGPPSRGWRPR